MLIQCGRKMTLPDATDPSAADRAPPGRYCWAASASHLIAACSRRKRSRDDLFRILIASSLIFELQACPASGSRVLSLDRSKPQSGAGCGASKAGSGRHICASLARRRAEHRLFQAEPSRVHSRKRRSRTPARRRSKALRRARAAGPDRSRRVARGPGPAGMTSSHRPSLLRREPGSAACSAAGLALYCPASWLGRPGVRLRDWTAAPTRLRHSHSGHRRRRARSRPPCADQASGLPLPRRAHRTANLAQPWRLGRRPSGAIVNGKPKLPSNNYG